MSRLLIASANPGKLLEIKAILGEQTIQFVTPEQIGLHLVVEEDGQSYAENAARKARVYARAAGMPVLADDSGLEVDALGGLPGIHSARFSKKPGATDADRRSYLLQLLQDHRRPWTAHFHCTVALSNPEGQCRFASGDCFGEIIPEERGEHGFGYDPIFLIPELGRTMAELDMDEKNRRSHRALAIKAAIPLLKQLLDSSNGWSAG